MSSTTVRLVTKAGRVGIVRYGVMLLGAVFFLAGCASDPVNIAPLPAAQSQKLGHASGTGCGTMLLLSTSSNFIPAGLNSRVDRAYAHALESVPGATALVDVTLEESWFWWVIGTTRCVTISGEAIK